MNFPALLIILSAITGVIWLFDRLFLASNRNEGEPLPVIAELARSFFPIIFAVLIIRSFIVEPFRIPSGSMLPTLHVGDFILVNKFSYGLRLPAINTKVVDINAPERGDVVVFRYPQNPSIDYIKRVVGLPGDKVGYFNKTVYINGTAIEQTPIEKDESLISLVPNRYQLNSELLGDAQHQILKDPQRNLGETEIIVPEGEYFVMGDNRDNSNDSRFWGTVPEENLVGKAFFIWMHWDFSKGKFGDVSWERVGTVIE